MFPGFGSERIAAGDVAINVCHGGDGPPLLLLHGYPQTHPDAVSQLAVLDIVPTKTIYETIDRQHATTVWRYFFLVQPHDLPERLIAGDCLGYLRWTLDAWCGTPGALDEQAIAEYARCFDRATIHASCEDYRAGATIDLTHDRADASHQLADVIGRERRRCPAGRSR